MHRMIVLGALTASALTLSTPVLGETAARVEFITGDGIALSRDGQARALAKGAEVAEGETVNTRNGRVQLRFSDGAFVSLQPQSQFRIDEYHFGGRADGSERGFFSLLQGGLRTITGLVGRTNKRNYQVSTAVATIGIRGTEYTASYGDGMSGAVGEGEIVVCNAGGCINVTNGEGYFVGGSDIRPTVTQKKTDLPPTQPDGTFPSFVSGDQTTEGGTPAGLILTGTQTLTSAVAGIWMGNALYSPDTVTFAADGSVTSMSSIGSITSLADIGNNGYIAWGRGIDQNGLPVAYVTGLATPASELANLAINAPIATYQAIGHTTPVVMPISLANQVRALNVNQVAVVSPSGTGPTLGIFNGATLTANFALARVDATVSVSVGGTDLVATASGVPIASTNKALTFDSSTCGACSNASMKGMFAGPNAQFAGLTYVIGNGQSTSLTSAGVVGAVVFAR